MPIADLQLTSFIIFALDYANQKFSCLRLALLKEPMFLLKKKNPQICTIFIKAAGTNFDIRVRESIMNQ